LRDVQSLHGSERVLGSQMGISHRHGDGLVTEKLLNGANVYPNHHEAAAVNAKTKIAIEGKDAYILDDTGREVKLSIEKKTKK